MEHVAIMKKSWGLTHEIISGKKKIESRWYKLKRSPWGKIKKGDTVYFKNSGEPVSIKAEVEKVIYLPSPPRADEGGDEALLHRPPDLTPKKVKQILKEYGRDDGIEKNKIPEFFKLFKDKKYCLLIFLKKPEKIKPFEINKTGFGTMSAWLVVEDVGMIKQSVD